MSRSTTTSARSHERRLGPVWRSVLALTIAWAVCAGASAVAYAGPVWSIASLANTTVAPGGVITYHVVIKNLGDTPAPATLGGDSGNCTPGSPPPSDPSKCFVLRADFPAELTPIAGEAPGGVPCTVQGSSIACRWTGSTPNEQIIHLSGQAARTVIFTAQLAGGVTGTVTSAFEVSGGEAANVASTVDPTLVSDAPPPFGIDSFDAQATADAAGNPATQAGGHPFDATTDILFNTLTNPAPPVGMLYPVESTKDVVVDLPAGFVGDTTVVDRCTTDQLTNGGLKPQPLCPSTSQVGTTLVQLNNSGFGTVFGPIPVYNMVPPPNVPARLAFNINGTIVAVDADLRTGGDYGLRATVHNVPELATQGTILTLWGVPSDPAHDPQRACPGFEKPSDSGVFCSSGRGASLEPFLRNPTSCTAPGVGLVTSVAIDSWEHPGVFATASARSHAPPGFPLPPSAWGPDLGIESCELVPFDPRLAGGPPAATRAGAPTGMSFDLSLRQTNDLETVATGDLKKAVVTLPEGVRVSPSAAAGLAACSPEQIALDSGADPACPNGAKVGTVQVDTPLLADPLKGSIYLATPFRNPFGSLLAMYLVVQGQGVTLKLPGLVQVDAETGQITTTIDNAPQAPFTNVHLAFDGGPRAALSLPNRCGTFETNAVLTSWSGKTVLSKSSFTISENTDGQPCPPRFAPRLDAGTESNTAGSSSSFLARIVRSDLDQELRALTVHAPGGVTGRIADVPLCGEQDAAAGSCPASSKIGDVTVGAGAGSNPFFITDGRAYLTGPYKGAPFGLSIVVPAVAGPFDLGTVVVRSAIRVDKHTAEIDIASDPLPRILQGIPLNVRDIRVNVNRPGFFLNATSCAEKAIEATFESTGGLTASASTRYQASDCASLRFQPRMVMTVGGRGHTARGRTTPFTTTLTMPRRGQANLRFVRVTLPRTINARLNTIQDACTRAEFERDLGTCAHAKAGTAVAITPLLRDPLRGTVFFVKNGNPIPDLFVALRGQVDFDLIGRVSIVNSRLLRTTFATAPDVPIRSFTLRLLGGASTASIGALVNLCSARGRRGKAQIDYIAQNGRVRQVGQRMVVKGCAKHPARRHRRGR